MGGTRWAFMSRQTIMDLERPDQVYLWRLRIFTTPWFGMMLHVIKMTDSDRGLHCHPWNFASLILRGGYVEEIPRPNGPDGTTTTRHLVPWHWSLKRAESRHRITWLFGKETWTLVFHGRLRRDWGFVVNGDWVDHETYLAARHG